jgi:hypothetical protein
MFPRREGEQKQNPSRRTARPPQREHQDLRSLPRSFVARKPRPRDHPSRPRTRPATPDPWRVSSGRACTNVVTATEATAPTVIAIYVLLLTRRDAVHDL